jgi:hypothetical protein
VISSFDLPSSILDPRLQGIVPIPHTFSFGVFFALLVILAASGRMFYVLTKQWTTHRPVAALRDWARDHDFELQPHSSTVLPESLAGLSALDPRIDVMLSGDRTLLIRVSTVAKPTSPRPVWHLLIRETVNAQSPAGLRPVQSTASFLDLFSLNGFPSLLPPERFVVYATESKDARALAGSHTRGLLPADIGLLVHGPYITLDFSARPFDTIEFDRMLAVMEQVVRFDSAARHG